MAAGWKGHSPEGSCLDRRLQGSDRLDRAAIGAAVHARRLGRDGRVHARLATEFRPQAVCPAQAPELGAFLLGDVGQVVATATGEGGGVPRVVELAGTLAAAGAAKPRAGAAIGAGGGGEGDTLFGILAVVAVAQDQCARLHGDTDAGNRDAGPRRPDPGERRAGAQMVFTMPAGNVDGEAGFAGGLSKAEATGHLEPPFIEMIWKMVVGGARVDTG